MPYDCWRGMVGIIKPTKGSGSLVEFDQDAAGRDRGDSALQQRPAWEDRRISGGDSGV